MVAAFARPDEYFSANFFACNQLDLHPIDFLLRKSLSSIHSSFIVGIDSHTSLLLTTYLNHLLTSSKRGMVYPSHLQFKIPISIGLQIWPGKFCACQ